MTDKLNEKVSALMDGNLGAREVDGLVEHMRQAESLRRCWAHYHLIGDALRNNLPDVVKHDLATRISQAIEAEAPLPTSLETHRHTKATSAQPPSRGTTAFPAFFKPLTGLAIAASVAAVAIVGFNMAGDIHPTGQQLVMAPLQNNASMMLSPSVVARVADQPAANSKLADYLEDHSKYSTASMVQGQMLPYVRMVGYAPKE